MKNACVVGSIRISIVHAEALAACENANLYAVCDIDAARLQTCIDTYGIIGYNDFAQMLKDPKVEVVHICTPHYLHKEMAVKALLAGKDAVLEKPAAIDSAELAELRRAYAASGRKLCLMLQNRTKRKHRAAEASYRNRRVPREPDRDRRLHDLVPRRSLLQLRSVARDMEIRRRRRAD